MDIIDLVVKYFMNGDIIFALIGLFLFLYIIWIRPIIKKNNEYEDNIKNILLKSDDDKIKANQLNEKIDKSYEQIKNLENIVINDINSNESKELKNNLKNVITFIERNNKVIISNNEKLDDIIKILKNIEKIIKLLSDELSKDNFEIKSLSKKINYIYELKEETENIDKKLKSIIKDYLIANDLDNDRINKIFNEE